MTWKKNKSEVFELICLKRDKILYRNDKTSRHTPDAIETEFNKPFKNFDEKGDKEINLKPYLHK